MTGCFPSFCFGNNAKPLPKEIALDETASQVKGPEEPPPKEQRPAQRLGTPQTKVYGEDTCEAKADAASDHQTAAPVEGGSHILLPGLSMPSESAALQSKLQVPFSELTFHALIGKGSFKQVYRGKWNNTNVAIVAMRRGGLVTEARLMQQLGAHPNLVQFYRWSTDQRGNEYVVVELVPFGSLDKVLAQFGPSLRNRSKLLMCEQICHAMCELAAEGVLHRDLAARNILVQSMQPVHVKVSDFGLARVSPNIADEAQAAGGRVLAHPGGNVASGSLLCTPPSTPGNTSAKSSYEAEEPLVPVRWSAPEVLRSGTGWSEKSDVYSYGVTMWEIFSNGAEPYASRSDHEAAAGIVGGDVLPRPKNCPHQVYSLMMDCWRHDPVQRPTFRQIANVYRRWREATVRAAAGKQAHSTPSSVLPSGPTSASGLGLGASSGNSGLLPDTGSLPTLPTLSALDPPGGPGAAARGVPSTAATAVEREVIGPVAACLPQAALSRRDDASSGRSLRSQESRADPGGAGVGARASDWDAAGGGVARGGGGGGGAGSGYLPVAAVWRPPHKSGSPSALDGPALDSGKPLEMIPSGEVLRVVEHSQPSRQRLQNMQCAAACSSNGGCGGGCSNSGLGGPPPPSTAAAGAAPGDGGVGNSPAAAVASKSPPSDEADLWNGVGTLEDAVMARRSGCGVGQTAGRPSGDVGGSCAAAGAGASGADEGTGAVDMGSGAAGCQQGAGGSGGGSDGTGPGPRAGVRVRGCCDSGTRRTELRITPTLASAAALPAAVNGTSSGAAAAAAQGCRAGAGEPAGSCRHQVGGGAAGGAGRGSSSLPRWGSDPVASGGAPCCCGGCGGRGKCACGSRCVCPAAEGVPIVARSPHCSRRSHGWEARARHGGSPGSGSCSGSDGEGRKAPRRRNTFAAGAAAGAAAVGAAAALPANRQSPLRRMWPPSYLESKRHTSNPQLFLRAATLIAYTQAPPDAPPAEAPTTPGSHTAFSTDASWPANAYEGVAMRDVVPVQAAAGYLAPPMGSGSYDRPSASGGGGVGGRSGPTGSTGPRWGRGGIASDDPGRQVRGMLRAAAAAATGGGGGHGGGGGGSVPGLCETCILSMEVETAIDPMISCSTAHSATMHRAFFAAREAAMAEAMGMAGGGGGALLRSPAGASPSPFMTEAVVCGSLGPPPLLHQRVSGLSGCGAAEEAQGDSNDSAIGQRCLDSLAAAALAVAAKRCAGLNGLPSDVTPSLLVQRPCLDHPACASQQYPATPLLAHETPAGASSEAQRDVGETGPAAPPAASANPLAVSTGQPQHHPWDGSGALRSGGQVPPGAAGCDAAAGGLEPGAEEPLPGLQSVAPGSLPPPRLGSLLKPYGLPRQPPSQPAVSAAPVHNPYQSIRYLDL